MKQLRWRPFRWHIIVTWSYGFGIGLWWRHARVNGVDFFFGPITLTIQPPAPAWLNQQSSDR